MLRSLIDSIKTKPKNRFSLENLQYLYEVLVRNPIINEQNKALIIETLRQIAELMIWGDQHNSEFFDFFLEKNILSFFLRILSQKTNKQVKIQLIQTLSILVENIRNENSIYYLFSNNHINELITHKFDFSDDEVLAYYISILKTLSLKLNPNTIQFFFNEIENDFALYTEAIKFFNHKDSMIRIAVRTLTLNVYKVEDEAMRRYILDKTAAPYFSNIVWYIRDQCTTLDSLLKTATHTNRVKLEDFIAELLDYFYYLHDIFNLGMTQMSEVLSDHLLQFLLLPQFVGSLSPHIPAPDLEDRLSPIVAVFLLSQVFYIFTYKPLINTLAAALLHPDPPSYSPAPKRILLPPAQRISKRYSSPNLQQLESSYQLPPPPTPSKHVNKYYAVLGQYLESDDRMILAVMVLLYSMMKNSAVDRVLLEIAALYPYRLKKAKKLLEALTTESDSPPSSSSIRHARSVSESDIDYSSRSLRSEKSLGNIQKKTISEIVPLDSNKLTDSNASNPEVTSSNDAEPLESSSNNKDSAEQTTSPQSTDAKKTSETTSISEDNNTTASVSEDNNTTENNTTAETTSDTKESENNETTSDSKDTENTETSDSKDTENNTTAETTSDTKETENDTTSEATSDGKVTDATETAVSEAASSTTNETDKSEDVKSTKEEEATIESESSSNGDSPGSDRESITESSNELQPKENTSSGTNTTVTDTTTPNPPQTNDNKSEETDNSTDEPQKESDIQLVEKLLKVFLKNMHVRLITLQMSILLARELVYSIDSSSNVTPSQLQIIQQAYSESVANLRTYLQGSLKDIFIEIFEQELKTFKQINFDSLTRDPTTLLLPVAATPMSGITLAKRLPSGEAEKTQRAVQGFLVLREFFYTMLRKKDDRLPFKEDPHPTIKPKDNLSLEGKEAIVCSVLAGATGGPKKKLQRFLVMESGYLIILEPDPRAPQKTTKNNLLLPSSGTVCNVIPLQSLQLEIDTTDKCKLHVTSHPTTSQFAFTLESESSCQSAEHALLKGKNKVRRNKTDQLEQMLNDAVT